MATIGTEPNGGKRILFVAGDRTRKTIRLGKVTRRQAEAFQLRVEQLVSNKITGHSAGNDTAHWLASLDERTYDKLVAVGLVEPRASTRTTLATFIDDYIASRTDLKTRTILNLKQARKSLVEHFGEKRLLANINRAEARQWQRALAEKLAPATVAMHVKKARQFFVEALDRKLITETPMRGLKAGSQANPERQHYVFIADIEKVIAACPDPEWKLIFALARYAGLRTPSETLRLTWKDILWHEERMVVWSPKTEHHEARGKRTVPIFPELLPYLRDVFDRAPERTTHVISLHRGENLRTTAEKIVNRAGLTAWPKLFQNLRSSCQTDLVARHPAHVACAWMGNTEAVARRHYLQVTEDDFAAAKSGLKGAAHNPAQQASAAAGTTTKTNPHQKQNRPVLPGDSAACVPVRAPGYPQGESNHLQDGTFSPGLS